MEKQLDRELAKTVSLPLVCGVGFHFAWVYATTISFSEVFFQNAPGASNQMIFYIISVLLLTVVSVAGYWAPFVGGSVAKAVTGLDYRRLAWVAAVLTSVSTLLLIGASLPGIAGSVLTVLTAIGTGVGSGLLMPVCWAVALGSCDSQKILVNFSLAMTFAFCLLLAIVHIPHLISAVVSSLLPLAERFFLGKQLAEMSSAIRVRGVAYSAIRPVRLFLRIGIPSVLFGVILGILQDLSVSSIVHTSSSGVQPILILGSLLAGPIIIFSTVAITGRRQGQYSKPLFAIIIIALALTFSYFASSEMLLLSVLLAYVCFSLLAWAVAADVVDVCNLPSLAVYTALRSSITIGVMLSVLTTRATGGLNDMLSGGSIAVPLALVVMFAIAMFFWPSQKDIDGCIKSPDLEDEPPADSTFAEASNVVARRYALSKRESEILVYLAQGRDIAYISKLMFVSVNTVKSHRRNIYSKLGVHSQQEVIELVQKEHRALRQSLAQADTVD